MRDDEVEGGLGTADLTIFVVYMVAVIAVGIYFQRKGTEDIASFFLGGRSLPWW